MAKLQADMHSSIGRESERVILQRLSDWLAAPSFAQPLEDSQDEREEGTSQWIFEDAAFQAWETSQPEARKSASAMEFSPDVLWIHGE